MGAIRSVLVHLDGSAYCPSRLALARTLAITHEARLTAVFAASQPALDVAFPYAAAAAVATSAMLQDVRTQRLARAMAAFDASRAMPHGEAAWAELQDDDPVAGVAQQALYADLVVLGQASPGEAVALDVPADFAASVVLHSGKPALLLPQASDLAARTSRAVVAWKATPESSRALAAALPLLARAERVHVVSWGPDRSPRCAGQPLDVERYLALHGVSCTVQHHRDEPRDIGQALLDTVDTVGAGLLVMGCYGHSRAREFVLGGATRSVLRSLKVPVLTSH